MIRKRGTERGGPPPAGDLLYRERGANIKKCRTMSKRDSQHQHQVLRQVVGTSRSLEEGQYNNKTRNSHLGSYLALVAFTKLSTEDSCFGTQQCLTANTRIRDTSFPTRSDIIMGQQWQQTQIYEAQLAEHARTQHHHLFHINKLETSKLKTSKLETSTLETSKLETSKLETSILLGQAMVQSQTSQEFFTMTWGATVRSSHIGSMAQTNQSREYLRSLMSR
jgi:hypothetical protein